MKKCNSCGVMLPDNAMFCTSCGTPADRASDGAIDVNDGLEDTSVLDENDLDATGLLTEEDNVNEVYSYEFSDNAAMPVENVNSAYVNPNFQKNPYPQTNSFQPNPANNMNSFQNQADISQNKMSYPDFYDKFASKKTKGYIKSTGIIAIITAVLSLVLLGMGNYLSALDVIVYTVSAILILKKKSWIFTLVLACYSGIFTIIGFALSGTPSGIVATIIAIFATVGGKKLSDAYQRYNSTGEFPFNEI